MSLDITSTVDELHQITQELKRRQEEISKLKKRKQELENVINKFLQERNQPGFKHKGRAIMREDKVKKVSKKKQDGMESAIRILQQNGVRDANDVYKKIIESQKTEKPVSKILITNV